MKVELSGMRVAQVGVRYDNRVPQMTYFTNDCSDAFFAKFRSVHIMLTIRFPFNICPKITFFGNSYCNPNDRFNKIKGRSIAMKQLLDTVPYNILTKEDRKLLCPIMLYGHRHE